MGGWEFTVAVPGKRIRMCDGFTAESITFSVTSECPMTAAQALPILDAVADATIVGTDEGGAAPRQKS